jgi:acetoin:2,6-dichlorophenolindophenol oxidoreductase subunit alpha
MSAYERRTMSENKQIGYLRTMIRIRAFEETVHAMYQKSELFGMSPHLSCGMEAIAVGACDCLRKDDYIVSTHRGHGHCIAKGADMRRMLAELCGKATGFCKGKGGTMHIADVDLGILGANGIVGGGIPIAVGAGLSISIRGTDQVSVCFFGDAASNQGTFHEAVNFATIFKLPVIFVCENNLYGLSTPYQYSGATPHVADRAKGYHIPGKSVNGMVVEEVRAAMAEAVKRARNGEGPSIIEGKTYRYYGHSASDNRRYRTREEEENVKSTSDPIMLLTKELVAKKLLTEKDVEKMQVEADAEAADAKQFTLNSPEPNVNTVMEDIFA